MYRKFSDIDEEEEVIDTDDLGLLEHTPNGTSSAKPLRTLTRRSVRPRRLFQAEKQAEAKKVTEEEEEATTDVEENNNPSVDLPEEMSVAARPSADQDQATVKESKRKVNSPFDSWKRVKAGTTSGGRQESKGRKRGLEPSGTTDGAEKKAKAV